MKRYLAHVKSCGFDLGFKKITIKEIEVEKETPKTFYYNKQPRPRRYCDSFGGFYSCHETYAEAHAALIEYLEKKEDEKFQNADLLQKEARELRAKIEELNKENLK